MPRCRRRLQEIARNGYTFRMPDYASLPILTEINKIVEKHKQKPIPEQEAKQAILVILNKYVKMGLENAKIRLKYVTDQRDACKKTLERMEALLRDLKAPEYIPEPYKLPECKSGLTLISLSLDAVHQDATTMFAKMSEFRASWGGTVQQVCKDVGFLDGFIAVRTNSMTLGKQAEALEERLVEYKKRAEIIAADAEKTRNGAAQGSQELIAEANKMVAQIEAVEADGAKSVKAVTTKLKSLVGMKTQKIYTGKEHKVAISFVADIEKERKNVAGQCKTAEQIKARLDPMIASKKFLLTAVKQRLDKVWPLLDGHKNETRKAKEDGDKVLVELEKRFKK